MEADVLAREPLPWSVVALWVFAAATFAFALYFAVATGFVDAPRRF